MPRFAYVNGSYVPHHAASVHIEDRGYQFADGIYEVISLINGRFADERGHLDRLERSLRELEIAMPVKRQALRLIMRELVRKNRLSNAALYIQVTRGVAKRDFKFPNPSVPPALVMTCRPFKFDGNSNIANGVKLISVPDIRWKRRDIKTVGLLAQALAKQKAAGSGAFEALMIDEDGFITEGSSSNFWILQGKTLITRPAEYDILKGVTRNAALHGAAQLGLEVQERAISLQEALSADEAFCTSATALIVPVVDIDGQKIGKGAQSGKSGAVTLKLYEHYREYALSRYDDQYEWSDA
ncbi:MAG: D-amino-acid transaminase [Alphaproteobacteria bacterium]